ncbi:MAG: hypothetical protein QW707_09050 [Candidatus Bathyarchaeia archaeon]
MSFCQNFFKRIYENGYIIDRDIEELHCDSCRQSKKISRKWD